MDDNPFRASEVTSFSPLAWVTQGLVVYIRGAWTPLWDELVTAWQLVSASELGASLKYVRFSDEMEWRALGREGLQSVRHVIEQAGGRRPFWRVEAANQIERPESSVEFADLHTTAGRQRASYFRIRMPMASSPRSLLTIALHFLERVPALSGSAGYQFNAAEDGREAAYDQIWAWARRYWGVEVVNPQAGSWDALNGLLGVNWLTLVGADLRQQKLSAIDFGTPADDGLEILPGRYGTIIQAGTSPKLGDLNNFEDISSYVAAARLVAPALIEKPSGFFGMFVDQKSAGPWVRRFLSPNEWLEPDAV